MTRARDRDAARVRSRSSPRTRAARARCSRTSASRASRSIALDAHASERDVARIVARLAGGRARRARDRRGHARRERSRARRSSRAADRRGRRASCRSRAPSAVLAALVASGLAGDGRFRFVGFLPRDGAARREAIALVVRDARAGRALRGAEPGARRRSRELADATPERGACVARELTKLHEEFVAATLRGARRGRARVDRRDRRSSSAPHAPEDRAVAGRRRGARRAHRRGARRAATTRGRSPSGSRPGADGRGARSTNASWNGRSAEAARNRALSPREPAPFVHSGRLGGKLMLDPAVNAIQARRSSPRGGPSSCEASSPSSFGILVLASPNVGVAVLILMFAAYAAVDGVVALATAVNHGRAGLQLGLVARRGHRQPRRSRRSRWRGRGSRSWRSCCSSPSAPSCSGSSSWAARSPGTRARPPVAARRHRASCRSLFGVLLIAQPLAGAAALVWVVGVYAVVFGVMLVVVGLRALGQSGTPPTSARASTHSLTRSARVHASFARAGSAARRNRDARGTRSR